MHRHLYSSQTKEFQQKQGLNSHKMQSYLYSSQTK